MSWVDIVIIVIILLAVVIGFSRGLIKEGVTFIGVLLVLILSFYLKDPIAYFLTKYLPLINFFGPIKGYTSLSIFFYQILAFLIVFVILYAILQIFIYVSKWLEKLLDATVVLGFLSRLLGGVMGIFVGAFFAFAFAIIITNPFMMDKKSVANSKLRYFLVEKTPVLSKAGKKTMQLSKEISSLFKENLKPTEFNYRTYNLMLKYNVVDKDFIRFLYNNNKLDLPREYLDLLLGT